MLRLLAFAGVLFLSAEAVASTPPAPSLKPDRPFASKVVSTQDAGLLHAALEAADAGDWSRVARYQARAGSPVVQDLILWRRAHVGAPGLYFEDMAEAIERLEGWPDAYRMRARAEALIGSSGQSAQARAEWLTADGGPVSGEGHVALADARRALGDDAGARAALRTAWRGMTLDLETERKVLGKYGAWLSQDDHRARADFLLWTGQRSAADRLKPRLTADWQRLVEARIALAAGYRGVDARIAAVPEALQAHPGLLFDRAQWRRKRGRQDSATPLLTGIDGADVPESGRGRLWDERHIALRDALESKSYATAYSLAEAHGLSSGVDFAQAEWLSGWIALRMKDDPSRAVAHFRRLDEGVSTPISTSRAQYWRGRAHDAMGDGAPAEEAFAGAARFKYTFYGQLAAERIGDRTLAFAASPEPTEADRARFEARPMVKVLRLLAEQGETGLFRKFAFHLDDRLETEADYLLLQELAREYKVEDVGVRGAKEGLSRGIVAPEAAYPVVSYPLLREPQVERSLMLALSRQESEMNPRAISHADARGLMQFLPRTARYEAQRRGLPFRTSWLTDDPGYNMTIGGAHLDTLLDRFNGSYVMTAAAYNAGSSRPRAWIRTFGDPRRGEVDTVDWIEMIPFAETRNYVQRVLENTQVYRHRLSGEPVDIQLNEDLERGQLR